MKIAFRADASLQMGSGHVMRCLTLADALRAQGAQCHFISRAHPGHLLEAIRQRGYKANSLVAPVQQAQEAIKNIAKKVPDLQQKPTHAAWLGSTWQTDAQETGDILARLQPDWLVVDHYALDQRWEEALAPHYRKLLVIDDLADRPHRCDLLLDQNLGRQPEHYVQWMPAHCQVLTGPHYALLRPEFAALRPYSLQRRKAQPALRQLLITMGGVDQPNATGQVLQALKTCALPAECHITVVMGLTAPWLQNVRELAAQMPWPTEVVVNVNDMARRMADSDLAIGAAGSTSWERCCLGLPTLMVVLADNQRDIATALEHACAAITLDIHKDAQFATELKNAIVNLVSNEIALMNLSHAASNVTTGCGTNLVADQMLDKSSS
ncbi:UDP-2,4-diacetamido-2,4,6-trideoxy-beta-L-altropyranose hydrolase [Polaromonas sp.]|uniref:UDP-2,4-diacetamido-2,4, 6-trideoxy-beta-L-altropyranose hydrolase n=1 Tax=Polaromonas sp. TaxID=1869339 RepID=UPI0017FBA414|nr:UDP-2,4-diacetamido-2,4,6-trideoxy-beta-L-altropyranose hydrolase [Polaromonas sp.]NMM06001.1 UDP-2,4-diacetamido-2,4,6-trideoxy-beta-L-altropyranose hydrolase [Polaromonas sp.]